MKKETSDENVVSNEISREVLDIQRILNKLKIRDKRGRRLEEDGILTKNTEFSIKAMKEILDLPVNIDITEEFKNCLDEILSKPVLKIESKGNAVRYVQWRLEQKITGVFEKKNRVAAMIFQKQKELALNGIVDMNTWNALLENRME